MSTVRPRPAPTVLAPAPLDGQARLVLVAWLCGWFALVAAVTGLWVAGGGALALSAAILAVAGIPLLVLGRLAGLPAAFVIERGELVVRRYLLGDRPYRLRGRPVRAPGSAALRRRAVLLGGGYGCRTLRLGDGREVHLATTSLHEVLRVETGAGALLVSPADPEAFATAVREALP